MSGKKLLFAVLAVWLLLNWIQAGLSELDPDESYYWMYSKVLDWGYFDHPPFLALLINVGYSLYPNEFGVRFMVVILQVISIYVIWLIVGKPKERTELATILAVLAAIPVLQVYGFIATPDGPLLFFTTLFFYAYQLFCRQATFGRTIFLGVCMAALLYSKYHGLLIILFTTFSNLSLFKKKEWYVAGFLGVVLFLPHLYWQYIHDFPSFRYHLKGRDDIYELKHTTEYIMNQLVIFSPFLFPLFIYSLSKYKIKTALERAFYFIIIGFWGFFFYTTFKGGVEPQWTAILSFPLAIIAYRYSLENPRLGLWLRRMAFLTIGLLLIARVFIIIPVPSIKSNFHNTAWIPELQKASEGYPVVFENSYRDASKYTFYSGELAYTFTDVKYRKNQYDIWDWEKNLHNQKVFMVGAADWECTGCTLLKPPRKTYLVKVIDSLQISQKVELEASNLVPSSKVGAIAKLELEIRNPYKHDVHLDRGNMPIEAKAIFAKDGVVLDQRIMDLELYSPIFPKGDTLNVQASFIVPDTLTGNFDLSFGLQTGDLPASFNSHSVDFTIKN